MMYNKVQIEKDKRRAWEGGLIRNNREFHLILLAAIPLIQVFIFCYLPMFGLIIAFKDFRFDKGIMDSKWVGVDNFKFFITSSDFAKVAWNTIYLNAIFIAVGMICAILLAILLFELKSKIATKTYQTVLITPNFLSWVVVGYMVYAFLNAEYGIANHFFMNTFAMDKINWYAKPEVWPFILAVASIWKFVGIDSIFYYANLMGIDSALFEAAEIDGANKLQKIKYITLPCLKHLAIMLLILKIGNIFRADFGLFYQLTRNVGALYSTTDVMDTYIFRALREVGDMSMASAAGFLQSVVGFILVILTNLAVKKMDSDSALF